MATNSENPKLLDLPKKAIKIEGGNGNGFALMEDGSLYGWGYNSYNQISSETNSSLFSPITVQGLPKLLDISIMYYHVLGLDLEGGIWTWGYNGYRQCSNYSTEKQAIPEKIIMPVAVKKITSGLSFSAMLGVDNSVYGMGNLDSVMGSGSGVNKISADLNVVDITAGSNHLLILTDDGSLYAMGYNGYGQLGTGDTINRSIPTKVNIPASVRSIATSASDSFAIDIDGRIWAWGYNASGNLGDGTTTSRYSPIEIFLP
jgi:alpha-tubulin suppressor-like RCC1 family protein